MELYTYKLTEKSRKINPVNHRPSTKTTNGAGVQTLHDLLEPCDFLYFTFDHLSQTANIRCGTRGVVKAMDYLHLPHPFFAPWIHPDDLPFVFRFEAMRRKFWSTLSPQNRTAYKARYNCRLQTKSGAYLHFLHRFKPFRINRKGQIVKSTVVLTDISHINNPCPMSLDFIGPEGQSSYYGVDVSHKNPLPGPNLTKREREVLAHLAANEATCDIAQALFISKNTVANHRKNIMRKTDTHSILELVLKAKSNGWV